MLVEEITFLILCTEAAHGDHEIVNASLECLPIVHTVEEFVRVLFYLR